MTRNYQNLAGGKQMIQLVFGQMEVQKVRDVAFVEDDGRVVMPEKVASMAMVAENLDEQVEVPRLQRFYGIPVLSDLSGQQCVEFGFQADSLLVKDVERVDPQLPCELASMGVRLMAEVSPLEALAAGRRAVVACSTPAKRIEMSYLLQNHSSGTAWVDLRASESRYVDYIMTSASRFYTWCHTSVYPRVRVTNLVHMTQEKLSRMDVGTAATHAVTVERRSATLLSGVARKVKACAMPAWCAAVLSFVPKAAADGNATALLTSSIANDLQSELTRRVPVNVVDVGWMSSDQTRMVRSLHQALACTVMVGSAIHTLPDRVRLWASIAALASAVWLRDVLWMLATAGVVLSVLWRACVKRDKPGERKLARGKIRVFVAVFVALVWYDAAFIAAPILVEPMLYAARMVAIGSVWSVSPIASVFRDVVGLVGTLAMWFGTVVAQMAVCGYEVLRVLYA